MTKLIIPEGTREVYVSDVGSDGNSGKSLMFPKLTVGAASLAAFDLNPTAIAPVAILDPGESIYTGTFVIFDDVFISLPNATIVGEGGVAVSAGNNATARISEVLIPDMSAIAYSTNSKTRICVVAEKISMDAILQIGISNDGTAFETSVQVGLIIAAENGAVCVRHTTSGAIHSYTINRIVMEGDNSTAIFYDSSSSVATSMTVGYIVSAGSGNIAIDMVSGLLTITTGDVSGDVVVASGATLNFNGGVIVGDITVNAGGTLNIKSVSHTGTLTNNGTINGSIYNTGDDKTTVFGDVEFLGFVQLPSNIGSIVSPSNLTETVIGFVNTWTDLNLNAAAVLGSNAAMWSLADSTTGELQYDGENPFSGMLIASIDAVSIGGAQEFQFRAVVNGSPLSDGVVSAVDLSVLTLMNSTLIAPLNAVKDDKIRLQVQNVDGTSNITIRFMSMEVV